jgi:hypothetical protein
MSLPVDLFEQPAPATREALITHIADEGHDQLRVELVLEDGGRAYAALRTFELAWMGAGVGDIVWVRQAATAACF